MESIVNVARGYVRFEVSGARPEHLLNLMAAQGIVFWGATPSDDYVFRFTARRADAAKISPLAARAFCTVRQRRAGGAPELAFRLRKRYTLFLGLAAVLATLFWSSLHIWDIEVYGNETISRAEILNALEECGVGIGSFWPDFIPDNVRSRALARLPELSFLAVNVHGSRAEVIVREGIAKPDIVVEKAPSDIVAGSAGIITDMRIYRGVSAVKAGQTVIPGDVLVSGEVISPFAGPRQVHAMADVEARTWYAMTAARPVTAARKLYTGAEWSHYSLKIGREKINFYSDSGTGDTLCDKIVTEHRLSIGGLFTLPLTLVSERVVEYEIAEAELDMSAARVDLENGLLRTLEEHLGENGTIEQYAFTAAEKNGLLTVSLHAECVENIAVQREIK